MRFLPALFVCTALAAPAVHAQRPPLTPHDSALHALNRLAYGPRPGDVDRVAALGVMSWIDLQLRPGQVPDPDVERRESGFPILDEDPATLARAFAAVRQQRIAARQGGADSASPLGRRQPSPVDSQTALRVRRTMGQLQQLAVMRAVRSERQLQEVMVDFWTNHFNVFFGKGADRAFTPAYIERTIRPHALGRFQDLLLATAKSPAMLFYLDNWQSIAPGAESPALARMARIDDARREQMLARLPQGLNENYARELMELHTLGVDGGYTQQDVIAVARILTGWSIERPQQGGGFRFNDWAHDYGEKTVRGVRFPAGHGMDEGVRLLQLLAQDPATMHHISRQLCARFVSDDPPDGCVDAAVAAWSRSDGDIAEVLRAIFRSPEFWSPQALRAKVKTPLEFIVSAVRATGGDPDTTPRLAQVIGRLGEPLYGQPSPAGYPESQQDWVNSGALLLRMNMAVALAAGRLPGVTIALDSLVPATDDATALIETVDVRLLGGILTTHTTDVLRREVADVRDPVAARALVIGLALGGPEFQRQ
ncbi:MAG TPA: DUF1800 domain-containing protein [Gemmatimonadales bacterium]|nr:DUF1800 domain-containing protein [Gemmatimonadales bacterium]